MLNERVKKLRLEKGLTQSQLSVELGFARSSIAMIENGKRNASQEVIEKIADYFNVSIDYLLGRTDKRDKTEAMVDYLLERLVSEKIITDPNNIDNDTYEMIMNTIKAQLAFKIKKKGE